MDSRSSVPAAVEQQMPDQPIPWRQVAQVDCSKTPPPTSVGATSVVNSAIGPYVEGGSRVGDRFAYGFHLSEAERLVRVTITYPDDKLRTTQVSAWGPPQEALGSGFSCGDLVPLTNTMVRRQFVFFSKNRDVGIVIGTETPDQPAAVATILVEEAPPQLSPPAPEPALGAEDHRRIGLYWEDPIIARCFGEPDSEDDAEFELILKRLLDYCNWVGLNVISYPALWFPGPIYRSKLTSGYPIGARRHPPDILAKMAKRCSQRGAAFIPSFNFWRLDPIAEWVRTEEEVIASVPSINRVEITGKITTWENTGGFIAPKPNILHPVTQQVVTAMIEEVASQCAEYDSFAGIDFMLWPGCPLSFGASPRTECVGSYDDYSVGEFAKSINETPPGPAKGLERFVKRIRWINDDAKRKEAWIGWRCERLTDFYRSAAADLAAIKPGAKLGIGVYEPSAGPKWEGVDMGQVMREMGIDLPALAKDPNITVRRFVHQMIERYGMRDGRQRAKRVDLGNSKEFQAPLAAMPRMGAIFHQQYFELPITKHGKTLDLPAPFPSETEAISPNFGLRVSEPIYAGRDYLRYFAYAVRNFDAATVTVGGYVLGTQGAEPELREFARSFNALPAVLFETVSEADGVIVRMASAEQKTWVYALNLSATDRSVTLRLDSGCRNAATGQSLPLADGKATVTLRPYELLSLRSP